MAGLFTDIKNKALNAALNIADTFTPVLKESKFRETGYLTPEEFVMAGDFLTGHCPTWQWATSSSSKAIKDYLPKEKQFLITKNVPCSKRCRHLMDNLKDNQEKVVEEETGDGGWVDTHYYTDPKESSSNDLSNNHIHEITDDTIHKSNNLKHISELTKKSSINRSTDLKKSSTIKKDNEDENDSNENEDDEEDDGEAVDMESYDHNIRDDDDETTIVNLANNVLNKKQSNNTNNLTTKLETFATTEGKINLEDDADVFIPTRTYDLNITYDNYYRTPRLWLSGYDENNKPLKIEQMYEDISEDHAKKTVTFEAHPHILGTLMASIHPCRHAEVMKKLINLVAESGKELEVYSYLMVFLKFVQSVIPTIEYDYTRNITI